MNNPISDTLTLADKREEKIAKALEKIYSAAQPGAVYTEPVTAGSYTVITASKVIAGGGFGSGFEATVTPTQPLNEASPLQEESTNSTGGGIGGGGGSRGRPVAIVVIGPEGVTVKPVVDATRVILAGIAVWGSILLLLRRLIKARKS
jgi:uncharacterized spore protein YtfJ